MSVTSELPKTAILRRATLERIRLARPRIVMAIAPAGYGKSTLMRQYAATLDNPCVCDCADHRSPVAIARSIARILAQGDESRESAIAQLRLANDDASVWITLALDWWSMPTGHGLFVFENVEQICDEVENVEFFSRLLSRTPVERRIGICSRVALPFSWHRFFAPHEVQLLREPELRFERDEVAGAFGQSITERELDHVCDVSRGWPVAVLLLARMARAQPVSDVLERARSVEFESLFDYLTEEVLSSMPDDRFARLIAIAAIPRATSEEVALATDLPELDLHQHARASPFIYAIDDTVFEAHPLVRSMLWSRYAARCKETQLRLARALVARRPLRAAEIFLAAGDQEVASDILEREAAVYFVNDVALRFADLIEHIDAETLLKRPALWAATASFRTARMGNARWLNEALVVRSHLDDDAPLSVRFGVLLNLCNVLSNIGRHVEAIEAIHSIARPGESIPDAYQVVLQMFEAGITARRGFLDDGEAQWQAWQSRLGDVKISRAIAYEEIDARVARFRGERHVEALALRAALELAAASGVSHTHALILQDSIFGAWFAGEDDVVAQLLRDFDAMITPPIARATQVFRECARGNVGALRLREGYEHARIRAYAALIASSLVGQDDRPEIARRALDAAVEANEPLLMALAAVVCAETHPAQRDAYVRRALDVTANAQASRFRAAIAAYARRESCDMLEPLVRRYRSAIEIGVVDAPDTVHIVLLEGRVERGGKTASLSKRETELVMFLAAQRRSCSADELLDALWETNRASDQSVLRVYVRRVRAKLGDDAIVLIRGGYALGPSVSSDLRTIEETLSRVRAGQVLDDEHRDLLELHCKQLNSASLEATRLWEWFAPTAIRVEDLTREVLTLLGRDALASGHIDRALALSDDIVSRDPCDEPARELRIRAYLARGDRASACREFRVYRDVLASELGAKPSASLESLVQGSD